MNSTGCLVLRQNGSVVWNTTSQRPAQNPVAELLDSGNLVVRNEGEANPEGYLWQSFDYPCNTLLAGMKLGWDLRNGMERRITSRKSPDDPSQGDFSSGLVLNNYPEFYLINGTKKYYRLGPWNGLYFSGAPIRKPNFVLYREYVKNDFNYVPSKDELFYTYRTKNNSLITRGVINQTIYRYRRLLWVEHDQSWKIISEHPGDLCYNYGLCGPNGNCRISESPVCQCLQGFSPKSPQAWNSLNWTQGCVRNKPLSCNDKLNHGFVKLEGLKVPDTTHTWLDEIIDLDLCRVTCLNNCYCTAYTNSDIEGPGSGCVLWFGDLIDIIQFEAGGQDLYIRMPASELEPQNGRKMNTATIVATTVATICGMLLLCIYFVRGVRRNIVGHTILLMPFFCSTKKSQTEGKIRGWERNCCEETFNEVRTMND